MLGAAIRVLALPPRTEPAPALNKPTHQLLTTDRGGDFDPIRLTVVASPHVHQSYLF